jgi:hypothetical protein
VTEAKLADYVDWRLTQARRPAIVTLKKERTAIRQLLRFAKKRGYIAEVPEFAIKSGRTNARPDIPENEWHRLTRFLPVYVDRAQDKRHQRERFYLVLYIFWRDQIVELIKCNMPRCLGEGSRCIARDLCRLTRPIDDQHDHGHRPQDRTLG